MDDFRRTLLWGRLRAEPSARRGTSRGASLCGVCGLRKSAARRVSPARTRFTPAQTPASRPGGRLCGREGSYDVVRHEATVRYQQRNDSKFAFPLGAQLPREEAVTCIRRICREKSVFLKQHPPDRESGSFDGATRLCPADLERVNGGVISQSGFSFPSLLGWIRAWCGESGEC